MFCSFAVFDGGSGLPRFSVEMDVGPEVDIEAYAESTGREFEVDKVEGYFSAVMSAEGYELIIAFEPALKLEVVPSSDSLQLEAKVRSKSSSSRLFFDANPWILSSNNLSFSKYGLCKDWYFRSLSFNSLFSIVRSSIILL